MKPVCGHLQEKGHTSFGYIDDSFVCHETKEGCQETLHALTHLLERLGFVVHPDKSVLVPTQTITSLGYEIDSEQMVVRPTADKIQAFQELARGILGDRHPRIRQVARLIGKMVDLCKGCEYGINHYRSLEMDKILALKSARGDFEGRMRVEGRTPSGGCKMWRAPCFGSGRGRQG